MSGDFCYSWGGVALYSDVECQELSEHRGELDPDLKSPAIRITFETCPRPSNAEFERRGDRLRYSIGSEGQIIYMVPEVGDFEIFADGHIRCRVHEGSDRRAAFAHIVGPCLGALCYHWRWLAVHGCTVDLGGFASMFVGASGAGKSTLASAMVRQGLKLYSDDLSVLRRRSDGLGYDVHPSSSTLKLRSDSAAQVELGGDSGGVVVAHRPGKQVCRWPDLVPHKPLRVQHVYVLRRRAPGLAPVEPEFRKLVGSSAIAELMRNAYRAQPASLLGLGSQFLRDFSDLTDSVQVWELVYGSGYGVLDHVVEAVRAHETQPGSNERTSQRCDGHKIAHYRTSHCAIDG